MRARVRRAATTAGAVMLFGMLLGVVGFASNASGAGARRPAARALVAPAPTGGPKPGDVLSPVHSPVARTPSPSASRTVPGSGVSTSASVGSASAPRNSAPVSPTVGAADTKWWQWGAAAAAGLLAGAVGCYVLLRPHRRVAAPMPPTASPLRAAPTASPPQTPPSPPAPAAANLATLVSSVIATRDLLDPASVLSQRLGAALSSGGVQELIPIGQPFDPNRHRAVETASTTDPASADRIAEVQRVGYRDAQNTIRPPDVVVYRLEANR